MVQHTVIIGAGHGGVAVAAKLRALDTEAQITLINGEAAHPYQRPALSKAYLSGKSSLESIALRPASWFADNRINMRLEATVSAIDPNVKSVTLADGTSLAYDTLVLATGATPRHFPADKGGALSRVYTMRDVKDADRLKLEMHAGRKLVVIGGGYIGLEAASEAVKLSLNVTVLEAADRIVKRVACAQTSDYLRKLHESHGVNIREGVSIDHITGTDGAATGVRLASGETITADFIIVGIGITPNTALAEAAGLDVANGIVVDQNLRTSDPNIFAVGDCASFPSQGGSIRLESVQNANDQGAVVAANIGGEGKPYSSTPWFWSDQFDLKLQIAGLNTGYDDVLVQEEDGVVRSHFYFRNGQFIAADCFNSAATFVMARKLLDSGKVLTRHQAQVPGFSLKAFLAS